jgi:uncharacterized protein
MQFNLHNTLGNQFTSYSDTSVNISKKEYAYNLLVTPRTIEAIDFTKIEEFDLHRLSIILEKSQPDLLLIGTGGNIKPLNAQVLLELQKLRIGCEVMPIPALCRTFNYLIGEERNVAAIILFDILN